MANIFVFNCEKCGQALYSTTVKEGKNKLSEHKCFDEKEVVDYGNMPIEDFITIMKERLN